MAPKRGAKFEDKPDPKRANTGKPAAIPAAQSDAKSNLITPSLKAGSYRMVTKLKPNLTQNGDERQWPAVVCDTEMETFLFIGKKTPKSSKDVMEWPGNFYSDTRIPIRSKPVAVFFVGKNVAIYAPSHLLHQIDRSAMRQLERDDKVSDDFRAACALVLEEHSLDYWKAEMKGVPKALQESSDLPTGGSGADENGPTLASDEHAESLNEHVTSGPSAHSPDEPFGPALAATDLVAHPEELVTFFNTGNEFEGIDFNDPFSPVYSYAPNPAYGTPAYTPSSDFLSGQSSATHLTEPYNWPHNTGSEEESLFMTQPISDFSQLVPEVSPEGQATGFFNVPGQPPQGQMTGFSNIADQSFSEMAESQRRVDARMKNANRKCKETEVRIILAKNNQQYIVPKRQLDQSEYLSKQVEFDDEDGESKLSTIKLNRIDPDQFDAVAEFLNNGDYAPNLARTTNGEYVLEHFNRSDKEACRLLVVKSIHMCSIGGQLGLPCLRYKAVAKFKMLAPYTPRSFVDFLHVMGEQNFCNDDDLRTWVLNYTAENFWNFIDTVGRFASFMRENDDFAKMVYRLMAGLEAVDSKENKRKRSRKSTTSTPATTPAAADASPKPDLATIANAGQAHPGTKAARAARVLRKRV